MKTARYLALTAALSALTALPAWAEDVTGDVHRPSPSSKQYLSEAIRDAQHDRDDDFMERKFDHIDADRNGTISGIESKAFHDAKFAEIDSDGNGQITKAELHTKYEAVAAAHDSPHARTDRMLEHKFNEIDTDHDGMISRSESEFFHNQMFSKTDTNKDGLLSRDEVSARYRAYRDQNKRPVN